MKVYFLLITLAVLAVASEARDLSECEKHRKSALEIGTVMKLIPECEDNGDYKPLQCYKDSKFCVCYSKKGHPVSPISSKIKKCHCYTKRQEKIDSGHDNGIVPQCEEDGSWSKKQTWDYNNSCWCVDEEGVQQGKVRSDCDTLTCE